MGTTPKDANVEGSGTHFSRYAGDNESEASVEYVRKKAQYQNAKEFYKDKESTSTVGKILNSDAINAKIQDVKDIRVGHIPFDEEALSFIKSQGRTAKDYKGLCSFDIETNQPVIFVNTKDYSLNEVKETIFHELEHARQYMKVYNEEGFEGIQKLNQKTEKINKGLSIDDNYIDDVNEVAARDNANSLKAEMANYSDIKTRTAQNNDELASVQQDTTRLEKGTDTAGLEPRGNNSEVGTEGAGSASRHRTTSISERAKTITSNQQADDLLNEFVATTADKESISWKVSADNADEIYTKLMARGVRNLAGLREAFNKGDVDFVNWVVNKQLAAERLLGDLKAELRLTNADDIAKTNEILDSMTYLAKVSQQLGSAYGRGLNIQKFTNKARSIFLFKD